jgi:hypothetical protein
MDAASRRKYATPSAMEPDVFRDKKADAVVMRAMLIRVLSNPTPYREGDSYFWHTRPHVLPCLGCDAEEVLEGTAGRALAARVPLWRELEEATRARSPQSLTDDQRAILAALDEKPKEK